MTNQKIREDFEKDEPQFAFELELDGLDAMVARRVLTYYTKGYQAALSSPPEGLHIIDRGFKRCGTEATPTILIGFNENDWESRDKFCDWLKSASSSPSEES